MRLETYHCEFSFCKCYDEEIRENEKERLVCEKSLKIACKKCYAGEAFEGLPSRSRTKFFASFSDPGAAAVHALQVISSAYCSLGAFINSWPNLQCIGFLLLFYSYVIGITRYKQIHKEGFSIIRSNNSIRQVIFVLFISSLAA